MQILKLKTLVGYPKLNFHDIFNRNTFLENFRAHLFNSGNFYGLLSFDFVIDSSFSYFVLSVRD